MAHFLTYKLPDWLNVRCFDAADWASQKTRGLSCTGITSSIHQSPHYFLGPVHNSNNVEATFDTVVQLIAFDNVAGVDGA